MRYVHCTSFWQKLRGLLFTRPDHNLVLVFHNEKCLHSFFMRYPLKIVALDKQRKIIDIRILPPWRISRYYQRARYLLETADPNAYRKYAEGDTLTFE